MSLIVSRSFKLFPFGHTLSISYSSKSTTTQLSKLLDQLIRTIVVPTISHGEMMNIKGADLPQSTLAESAELSPTKDEVFFVSGHTYADNEQEILAKQDTSKAAFKLLLNSNFIDFPESGGIRYQAREKRTSNLPPFVELKDLGRAFPLEINYIRFGLEFFHMRSSLFGLVPDSNERISLEATPSSILFRVEAEALKSKTAWPERAGKIIGLFEALFNRQFVTHGASAILQ